MLLLTARGTPTIYYGDEIGMPGAEVPRDQITDPRELLTPYLGLGRDPARTPMQWDEQPGAGFSHGEPWLPVADDYAVHNVNQQSDDLRSTLSLFRRLIALRRELPALTAGGFTLLHRDEASLVYERAHGDQRLIVALNLTGEPRTIEQTSLTGQIVLSTQLDREGEAVASQIKLRADEGLVVMRGAR
jgi:alpha-glucosidase